jgi:hypothetical protein
MTVSLRPTKQIVNIGGPEQLLHDSVNWNDFAR